MQALGRRGDVLEVGEHPAGLQQRVDLADQRPLALILEMVDRHRGDDSVEAPEVRQGLGQVVLDELDAFLAVESLPRRGEHDLGEVETDAEHPGALAPQESEQAPVAGPDVEDASGVRGDLFEQDALALGAAGKAIRPLQVMLDVRAVRPLLGMHGVNYLRGIAASLHIAGIGSFAAEVAGWAADAGIEIEGLIDVQDQGRVGSTVHGLPVVALDRPPPDGTAILGLGGSRGDNWDLLADAGWSPGGVIHPRANVATTAEVAPSATIGPLAVVGAATTVGAHAILSRGALVGHHVRIGEFATLNPGVNVGGNSEIGAGAFLGMGSVIVNGTTIGAGATVAAGAVTIRDVADEARVQGVPALPYSSR